MRLTPEILTPDAFAPFGQLLHAGGGERFMINDGWAQRHHRLAEPDVDTGGGRCIISLFQATRRPFPLEIAMLERHPLGSQAFLPADPQPWLVVVAEGDAPRVQDCRAFLASGEQGVQYAKGVWHHPLLILAKTQNFWVVDRAGDGDNLEEVHFPDPCCLSGISALDDLNIA